MKREEIADLMAFVVVAEERASLAQQSAWAWRSQL